MGIPPAVINADELQGDPEVLYFHRSKNGSVEDLNILEMDAEDKLNTDQCSPSSVHGEETVCVLVPHADYCLPGKTRATELQTLWKKEESKKTSSVFFLLMVFRLLGSMNSFQDSEKLLALYPNFSTPPELLEKQIAFEIGQQAGVSTLTLLKTAVQQQPTDDPFEYHSLHLVPWIRIEEIPPSSAKVHLPSFLELGLGELVLICSNLCEMGTPPAVFDADQLQLDPEMEYGHHGGIRVCTNQQVSHLQRSILEGKIFKLEENLDRKISGFRNVPACKEVKEAIFRSLITNGMFDNTHIRLSLSRGKKVTSGMSPAFNRSGCTLTVLAEWKPLVYDNDSGIVLVTATTRRNSPLCLMEDGVKEEELGTLVVVVTCEITLKFFIDDDFADG
ncbi:unnamed protein product [Arabidopsis arenosa]|uniref:Uncharacterized protein n=1 Tax=Arabidopsis arenosa TaxID=38785 RepID=A0A8S2AKV3_ARAAE|nr:unnamed protein product [Arabidopsis arenosa]